MWTIKRFAVNTLQENCYVVSDNTGECVIIDCGAQFETECIAIQQYISQNNLTPTHLLDTHLHFDHVMGNEFLYQTFRLKCEASVRDQFLYNDVPGQVATFIGGLLAHFDAPFGRDLDEGDMVLFGNHHLQVIALPGHTPGGLGFYCQEEEVLFSGDSLFRQSVGRTDLPQGSHATLVKALTEKVLTLPPCTTVYPGHGPSTTVGEELQSNPYL